MTKVKIYSTTTCPYCKLVKEYFKEKGVEYEDVLLDQRPEEVQASIDTIKAARPGIHMEDIQMQALEEYYKTIML